MICGASVQFALDSVEIALTPENINNDICDNELFENYGDSGQYGHPEAVRTVRHESQKSNENFCKRSGNHEEKMKSSEKTIRTIDNM